MFRGLPFKHIDPLLIEDRDKCAIALWRFNNAANPMCGISHREREELLRTAIEGPRDLYRQPQQQQHSEFDNLRGSIGMDAVVEAPFNCHYGYNIKIGENVFIGANCRIEDSYSVDIGANTSIGANVTMFTAAPGPNLSQRNGARSKWQGAAISIGKEAHIGHNVVIYPGVHIEEGVRIAAGSVITERVTKYRDYGPPALLRINNGYT